MFKNLHDLQTIDRSWHVTMIYGMQVKREIEKGLLGFFALFHYISSDVLDLSRYLSFCQTFLKVRKCGTI